jgi:hypothetical protein
MSGLSLCRAEDSISTRRPLGLHRDAAGTSSPIRLLPSKTRFRFRRESFRRSSVSRGGAHTRVRETTSMVGEARGDASIEQGHRRGGLGPPGNGCRASGILLVGDPIRTCGSGSCPYRMMAHLGAGLAPEQRVFGRSAEDSGLVAFGDLRPHPARWGMTLGKVSAQSAALVGVRDRPRCRTCSQWWS